MEDSGQFFFKDKTKSIFIIKFKHSIDMVDLYYSVFFEF